MAGRTAFLTTHQRQKWDTPRRLALALPSILIPFLTGPLFGVIVTLRPETETEPYVSSLGEMLLLGGLVTIVLGGLVWLVWVLFGKRRILVPLPVKAILLGLYLSWVVLLMRSFAGELALFIQG